MKALCAMAAVGLSLMGSMDSASAQPYGGRDDGYRERDYGDRHRDYGDRDRGYGDRDRGAEYGGHESIAVGTLITERPPHRSVRAGFPHTAPTSGV